MLFLVRSQSIGPDLMHGLIKRLSGRLFRAAARDTGLPHDAGDGIIGLQRRLIARRTT